jgi:hypothetical protein
VAEVIGVGEHVKANDEIKRPMTRRVNFYERINAAVDKVKLRYVVSNVSFAGFGGFDPPDFGFVGARKVSGRLAILTPQVKDIVETEDVLACKVGIPVC